MQCTKRQLSQSYTFSTTVSMMNLVHVSSAVVYNQNVCKYKYPEHEQSWYGRLPATPLLLQCSSLSLRTMLTEVSWPIIPVRVGSLQFRTITGEN